MNRELPMEEEEAIKLCQSGDREAFRYVVERYQGLVYGTARLMTGNAAVAEELAQEAFISAWKGIGSFQNGRPLKPWLMRILVNRVRSERRRHSLPAIPLEEGDSVDSAEGPGDVAERAEEREAVRRALAALSEEHRQVVMLRYFAELSVAEIAGVLACREGTVKSRLHRALGQLRKAFGVEPGG